MDPLPARRQNRIPVVSGRREIAGPRPGRLFACALANKAELRYATWRDRFPASSSLCREALRLPSSQVRNSLPRVAFESGFREKSSKSLLRSGGSKIRLTLGRFASWRRQESFLSALTAACSRSLVP